MLPTIGFIGTGVMGKSMASHLLAGGYSVRVYNRTEEKAKDLVEQGAIWCESPKVVASESDLIITMVGFPKDVQSVYLGPEGLIENSRAGTLLIDMTTSSPILAEEIEKEAMIKGLYALDAPVSGGDVGAREARLSIMVGGEKEALAQAMPVFKVMGKQISHMGKAGMGQHTKMSNQIAIASNMMGVCEALWYAERSGLDGKQVLEAISAGAAGSASLVNLGPRILRKDYAPGFYIKHFIKDMKIALDSAEEMKIDLPGLKLSLKLYEELAQKGHENEGTQGLIQWYYTQV
ncbi:MAG: NAD(P)-dependent oxidoreductase [Negativicutes bacterium]|jgi:3-hydroxyisobutyrate dehydrogenase|nr:NAD(P)-dependent oxidoreductase [Negativicutes bacterium]